MRLRADRTSVGPTDRGSDRQSHGRGPTAKTGNRVNALSPPPAAGYYQRPSHKSNSRFISGAVTSVIQWSVYYVVENRSITF